MLYIVYAYITDIKLYISFRTSFSPLNVVFKISPSCWRQVGLVHSFKLPCGIILLYATPQFTLAPSEGHIGGFR